MILSSPLRRARLGANSWRCHAFTLLELLTVMAIIVVLAGLVLATVRLANTKAATARTQAEIKELETAINNYQIDFGAVPRASATTDTLDARTSQGDPSTPAYQNASLVLYQSLSGKYKNFSPSQLNGGTVKTTNGVIPADIPIKGVSDAFGGYYGYSTAYIAKLNPATNTSTGGYNPTYDLWSTGGFGGSGRAYPSDWTLPVQRSKLWITNWDQ